MGNRAFCSAMMCPKATLRPPADSELFDDTSACDPAGTVFTETLEDLNEVDRLLLVFASSSNLAAVRWLLPMGANVDACDTNGTTCLHAACRSGSLLVVREFIHHDLPLGATDIAGWTALHVALFMGRRSVAIELMRNGADLAQRNSKGLAPSDLCSDVWLREALNLCAAHRQLHGFGRTWDIGFEADTVEDIQISSKLRFEPFFVPRASVLKDIDVNDIKSLQRIGVEIFNNRPGQGLAFLVSANAVRDFPVELSNFLSENRVDLTQVGEFLGEDFSLSQTLRLEYINSVRLLGTGVVSCLAKVFTLFHIPSDMQKIDRLIDGVAQIWWRQHDQLVEKEGIPKQSVAEDERASRLTVRDGAEVQGLELMRYLEKYDHLHQLMFSAMMLHWNLYAPLPASQRLTLEQWLSMNEERPGVSPGAKRGAKAAALPEICAAIYNLVSQNFYPQLQIWSSRPANPQASSRSLAASPSRPPPSSVPPRALGEFGAGDSEAASMAGWAFLVGGGFPSFAGSSSGGTVTYRHIRSILSETTSTAFALASPAVSRQAPADAFPGHAGGLRNVGLSVTHDAAPPTSRRLPAIPVRGEAMSQNGRQDWVWMSMRNGLLFLAPKPSSWAPYAFVQLKGLVVFTSDRSTLTVSLVAARPSGAAGGPASALPRRPAGLRCSGAAAGDGGASEGPSMQLVFLLPDGRWQVLELPRLTVQVPDVKQLERWQRGLAANCSMSEATKAASESTTIAENNAASDSANMADEALETAEV